MAQVKSSSLLHVITVNIISYRVWAHNTIDFFGTSLIQSFFTKLFDPTCYTAPYHILFETEYKQELGEYSRTGAI